MTRDSLPAAKLIGQKTALHSWDALDAVTFKRQGEITRAFTAIGIHDFRAAAAYVAQLPYGRNRSREAALAVLQEHRGTCSTKHALLRRLAIEQQVNAKLMLGIYAMNGRNTLGVGKVLKQYRIAYIPEAHCYLSCGMKRIDVTYNSRERVLQILGEEEIAPEQIGTYKIELHRRFLADWAKDVPAGHAYEIEELWRIREECIAALALS